LLFKEWIPHEEVRDDVPSIDESFRDSRQAVIPLPRNRHPALPRAGSKLLQRVTSSIQQ